MTQLTDINRNGVKGQTVDVNVLTDRCIINEVVENITIYDGTMVFIRLHNW